MVYSDDQKHNQLIRVLGDLVNELRQVRFEIEALRESAVLLGTAPEEKVVDAPLNDIEDGTEPGEWISLYDIINHSTKLTCPFCGESRIYPIYAPKTYIRECPKCLHSMNPYAVGKL